MAQEYVALNNKEKGLIAINTKVFESIAQLCVEEEEFVNLADAQIFQSAVNCKIVDEKLTLQVNIKVDYNAKVNEVSQKLQSKIYDSIKHMSDCIVDSITINVSGFKF